MTTGFLMFFLSLIVLLIVLWADHRERTDAGRFKGFTLDAHQRAYLKAYFSSRRGRSHGLVMVACLGLYFGTMAVSMIVYDARWESCQAVRLRHLQEK